MRRNHRGWSLLWEGWEGRDPPWGTLMALELGAQKGFSATELIPGTPNFPLIVEVMGARAVALSGSSQAELIPSPGPGTASSSLHLLLNLPSQEPPERGCCSSFCSEHPEKPHGNGRQKCAFHTLPELGVLRFFCERHLRPPSPL